MEGRVPLHYLDLHLHLPLGLRKKKKNLTLKKKEDDGEKIKSPYGHCSVKGLIAQHEKVSPTPILALKTEVWIPVVLSLDE